MTKLPKNFGKLKKSTIKKAMAWGKKFEGLKHSVRVWQGVTGLYYINIENQYSYQSMAVTKDELELIVLYGRKLLIK